MQRAKDEAKRKEEARLRDLRAAADTRDDTRIKRETDALRDSLDFIRERANGQNFEKVRNNAARHSREIYDVGNEQALRDFNAEKGKSPEVAGAKLLADRYRLDRELAERRADIIAATLTYETRIQEGAKARAEIQEKGNREALDAYGKFLEEVDAPALTAAFEAAQKGGDLAAKLEASNALLDNAIRRADSKYYAMLKDAHGDPSALTTAYETRKSAVTLATSERDKQASIAAVIDALSFTSSAFADKPASPEQARQIEQNRERYIKGRDDATGLTRDAVDGAQQASRSLIRGILSGENGALESGFAALGEITGASIADYTTRRFVEGPLETLFDRLAGKIASGGMDAANAILSGANALAVVAGLFSQPDDKKKKGGILGAVVGGLAGFLIGGPMGAITGVSAGAQLGQGNILGGLMSIGMGALGGPKGGIGTKPGGGVSFGKSVFGFAEGGFPMANRLAGAGERGAELMFGQGGVTVLGAGGFARFMPTGRNFVLPNDASSRLVKVAAAISGAASGAGRGTVSDEGSGGDRGIVNNFYGDIHDRLDVDIVERQMDKKRYIQSLTH